MTWPGYEISQPFPSNAFRTVEANGKLVAFSHDTGTAGALGAGSYVLFDPVTESATTGTGSGVTGAIRALTNGTTALQCRSTTQLTRLTPPGTPSATAATSNMGTNAPAMAVVGNTVVVFAPTGGVRHYDIATDSWSTPGYATGTTYASTGGAAYAGGYVWTGHFNSIRQHTAAGQFIAEHPITSGGSAMVYVDAWGDNLLVQRSALGAVGVLDTSTFAYAETIVGAPLTGYPFIDQANDVWYMLTSGGAGMAAVHLPTFKTHIDTLPTSRGRRHQPIVSNGHVWIGSGEPTSGARPGTWLKLDLWVPPTGSGWSVGLSMSRDGWSVS